MRESATYLRIPSASQQSGRPLKRRLAPVPVRSPVHAEGAPEPALSLPKGRSLLGTGDGSHADHSRWYRELRTDSPICEAQMDGWIGE